MAYLTTTLLTSGNSDLSCGFIRIRKSQEEIRFICKSLEGDLNQQTELESSFSLILPPCLFSLYYNIRITQVAKKQKGDKMH